MTKIKPFAALVYNKDKIARLSEVVCPPYDIISVQKQEYYHALSRYNFIHLLLAKESPGKDRYDLASERFNEWLKEKILLKDKSPAVYFYSHQYRINAEKRTRFGFIALLHLGEAAPSAYAHEHTRQEAKDDRLKLLRKVKANLSPIFVLFQDKKKVINYMQQYCVKEGIPFIDITDEDNNMHRLWRIDDPAVLEIIRQKMQDESIFIADGHHRFEVACAYRDEMRQRSGSGADSDAPWEYLLTYFTNMEPLGLTIMPIHRLVKLTDAPDMEGLIRSLSRNFYVEEIKDRMKFFFLLQKAGTGEHALGMYHGKKYWLLRLRNVKILDALIHDKPSEYRSLDVSILNYLILKDVLRLDLENPHTVTFNAQAQELIDQVDQDNNRIAFLLNPTKIQQILAVALHGIKMPPKSTYFYPKVLSGLVINAHE